MDSGGRLSDSGVFPLQKAPDGEGASRKYLISDSFFRV